MPKVKTKHTPWVICYICGKVHKDYYSGSWRFEKINGRYRVICAWHTDDEIKRFEKSLKVENNKKTIQMRL